LRIWSDKLDEEKEKVLKRMWKEKEIKLRLEKGNGGIRMRAILGLWRNRIEDCEV